MKAKRSIKLTPQTGIMLMLFHCMSVITLTFCQHIPGIASAGKGDHETGFGPNLDTRQ